MDLPVNHFKRMLRESRTIFGAWLMSGTPATAEALGCAGFDFLVVDMEHVPVDTAQMIDILRALAGTPAPGVVRLPWNDMVMIKRALDGGAQTVMLPFVQNADEARRAVSSTRYPPGGVRGVAGLHRASRYATIPDYLAQAEAELCVIVQIETLAALEQLPQIAAVPGIDAIFIGPSDLAASMGLLGDIANPALQQKLEEGARMCARLGKPCGIIGGNPEFVARFVDYGYNWIAIGSDMSFMVGRGQEWLAKAKGLAPAAAPRSQGAY
jgi:2-dehydro-3-deoxyglucarate aldolase/4-hydroxy-2-oxoheptanedioate aldolase